MIDRDDSSFAAFGVVAFERESSGLEIDARPFQAEEFVFSASGVDGQQDEREQMPCLAYLLGGFNELGCFIPCAIMWSHD